MKFEDILTEVGEFGFYQKRLFVIQCLLSLNLGILLMGAVFISADQDFRCAITGYDNDTYAIQSPHHSLLINASIPYSDGDDMLYDQCNVYNASTTSQLNEHGIPTNASKTACNRWVYDTSIFESTTTSAMNLVCSNKLKTSHAQMLFMGGLLVGSFVFGNIADLFGRKTTVLISSVLHLAFGAGLAWVPTYIGFLFLRFLQGAAITGIMLPGYVLTMELIGPSKRVFAGSISGVWFGLGSAVLAGIAYFIRDWQILQVVCVATTLPGIICFCLWTPESPMWLLNRGKKEQVKVVLQAMAKLNRKTLTEKCLEDLEEPQEEIVHNDRLWNLFTNRVLLFRTLVIFFTWLVISMVYYGLSLNTGNLGGNLFLNFAISGVVDALSNVFCIFLLDRVGRKRLLAFNMAVGGTACIATLFDVFITKNDLQPIIIALAMIGRMGASASFTIIYLFSAELFPTAVRNGAIGVSSFCARIGSMVAPYVAALGKLIGGNYGGILPLLVFGGSSIVSGLLILTLPETLNKKLPDTIEDALNYSKPASVQLSVQMNGEVAGQKEPVKLSSIKMTGVTNEAYRLDDEKI